MVGVLAPGVRLSRLGREVAVIGANVSEVSGGGWVAAVGSEGTDTFLYSYLRMVDVAPVFGYGSSGSKACRRAREIGRCTRGLAPGV